MKDFEERHGVRIFQAWGMTETSPVATYSRPREGEHDDAYWDDRAKQGRPLPWVELRLIDDDGSEVPWDGSRPARSRCAGRGSPRATSTTIRTAEKFDARLAAHGRHRGGRREGFVQITDRSKDVIKSGGEWISSVELENEVMAHPDVVEAAVIAKPDERWAERPLCCVVLREGASASAEELVEHLRGRVAKWWLPDEFAFVAEIPKTSVGKFDKKVLRGRLTDGTLEGRVQRLLRAAREGGRALGSLTAFHGPFSARLRPGPLIDLLSPIGRRVRAERRTRQTILPPS